MVSTDLNKIYNINLRNLKKVNKRVQTDLLSKYLHNLFYKLILLYFKDSKNKNDEIKNKIRNKYEHLVRKEKSNFYETFLKDYLSDFMKDLGDRLRNYSINLHYDIFKEKKKEKINNIIVPNDLFAPDSNNSIIWFLGGVKFVDTVDENKEGEVGTEIFSYIYESYISKKKKRIFGVYYTNRIIVNFMVKDILINYISDKTEIEYKEIVHLFNQRILRFKNNLSQKQLILILNILKKIRILDPACGTGIFLVSTIEMLLRIVNNCEELIKTKSSSQIDRNFNWRLYFIKNCLFGIEIDEYMIEITKLRLIFPIIFDGKNNINKKVEFNIVNRDFTILSSFEDIFRTKFNIIIGNPPYAARGRGVNKKIAAKFGLKSKDIFGIFIVQSLNFLLNDGFLMFLTSDTWRTIRSHKLLREIILNKTEIRQLILLPDWCFRATVDISMFLLKNDPNKRAVEIKKNKIKTYDISFIEINNFKRLNKILKNILRKPKLKKSNISSIKKYSYSQNILSNYSKSPIIIASPKIFKLMYDQNCVKGKIKWKGATITVYKIRFNNKSFKKFKFEEIATIKQGLGTGDNKYYIRKEKKETYGNYKLVKPDLILNLNQFNDFANRFKESYNSSGEIIGIEDSDYDGRVYIPYDKGAQSNIDEGWLPNYWVPTNYYINWSDKSVKRLKRLTIKQRKIYYHKYEKIREKKDIKIASRLQNIQYYFKKGITFSDTGFYAPTFRLNHATIFDVMGMTIFTNKLSLEFCLGVLCSKLIKYLIKNYINSTIHTQVEGIKPIPIPYINSDNKDLADKIEKLVLKIINKQKNNLKYKYPLFEQKEIDNLVYKLYNLNIEDIEEVEDWYKRRYPLFVEKLKEIEMEINNL